MCYSSAMNFAVVLGVWLASASQGTIVVPQSIEELTQKSDVVVLGAVVGQESKWSPDHQLIYTFVRIHVEDALKGTSDREILVRRPGGTVGEIGQRVQGSAEFTLGERVLVFLSLLPTARPLFQLTGMAQGKLTLQEDNGVTQAVQDTRDLSFSKGGQVAHGGVVAMPLSNVLSRIKQAIGAH